MYYSSASWPRTPSTPPRQILRLPGSTHAPETPRHHKSSSVDGLRGTKPLTSEPGALRRRLKKALKLTFDPDPWQLELISCLLRGFDAILCTGTGYGKSLIFEGLAVLGGRGKVVMVISPLKALERDQVEQAAQKGIEAIMINEDNSHDAKVWEVACKTSQLVYLSPEMSLCEGFSKIWRDPVFRNRLLAVIVDKAHCVEEWGVASFRMEYSELSALRHYTGQNRPFLACTATCSTSTFDILFRSLGFGHCPFWGIDMGCDHPNLFYDIQPLTNSKNPVLDVLDILPPLLDASTPCDTLPKALLYFDSQDACRSATHTSRKCLPAQLRDAVYVFLSIHSDWAKKQMWGRFADGYHRILCATDAAGMGCC